MTDVLLKTRNQIELASLPTAVYRLRRDDGTLLYVGVAADPAKRWIQHARGKPWFAEVANYSAEWFHNRALALAAEAAAIKAERPLHNVVHQPRPPRPKQQYGNANARRKTTRRQVALSDPIWDGLGELVGDRGRSEVIRSLVAWYLREPGAKLPERPPRAD